MIVLLTLLWALNGLNPCLAAPALDPSIQGSNLTLPTITCPTHHMLSISANAIHDPFDYHENGMISTWEFYGFVGRRRITSQFAALSAWRLADSDAISRARTGHADQRLGTQTRTWSASGRSPQARSMRVDLVLIPRGEGMTWRILAEGFRGAERLICGDGREFQFVVFAAGSEQEFAIGQMTMRDSMHSPEANV